MENIAKKLEHNRKKFIWVNTEVQIGLERKDKDGIIYRSWLKAKACRLTYLMADL